MSKKSFKQRTSKMSDKQMGRIVKSNLQDAIERDRMIRARYQMVMSQPEITLDLSWLYEPAQIELNK